MARAARAAGVHLCVGVVERLPGAGSTLYCTLAYYGPGGDLLGIHRKLKPTAAERIIWGEGDGSTLTVLDTEIGRVGGLICWENYMPLARMAMYGKGVEVYLAPNDISGRELAEKLDVSPSTLSRVLKGSSRVTPEMALRLAKALGRSPESWLAMQDAHDLWLARQQVDLGRVTRLEGLAA